MTKRCICVTKHFPGCPVHGRRAVRIEKGHQQGAYFTARLAVRKDPEIMTLEKAESVAASIRRIGDSMPAVAVVEVESVTEAPGFRAAPSAPAEPATAAVTRGLDHRLAAEFLAALVEDVVDVRDAEDAWRAPGCAEVRAAGVAAAAKLRTLAALPPEADASDAYRDDAGPAVEEFLAAIASVPGSSGSAMIELASHVAGFAENHLE